MRQIELTHDPQQTLVQALNGRLASVWTALPGIVQSFDPTKKTAVVQPAIRMYQFDVNGVSTPVDLPLLVDCPVQFPGGGGYTLTFPVAAGDECLILFGARCIDSWWTSGGVQSQAVLRMHDLSDGFALVGISSLPNVTPNISATTTQLRSNDGSTYVEVGPAEVSFKAANVNILASSEVNVTTPTFTVNGNQVITENLTVQGSITV